MKKFHIAIAVASISDSVKDYTKRLGQEPQLVIPEQYALWRTATLNFSIRKVPGEEGVVRHLGWEDSSANDFSSEEDVNGILWEHFNPQNQAEEIREAWPEVEKLDS